MKIIIDARELRTSTGRYVERLLFYLQQIDNTNDYTVLLKPKDIDGWHPSGPNFQKVACKYKEFSLGEQLGYLWQLRSLKADLVHFPMPQQPVLYGGKKVTSILDLTTARFRNPSKNPVVFSFKQFVYKWLIKQVARSSEKIITISEFTKNDVANFCNINKSKIVVAYPAADKITEPAHPMPELVNKQFLFYIGRPQPHKNLRRLIDAFAILQKNNPDLYLVLAGKKDVLYAQHEQYVKKAGLKSVYFTGFVSEGQLRWLYENTVAYVFPSLSEGFGLPGLEAMVHGAPVVSSSATCLPEIYGEAAIYFDPLDINDMAEKINNVLNDTKLHDRLVKLGYKQAAKYSWDKMARQTLQVYEDVLKKNT